jgi:hypothetical protein
MDDADRAGIDEDMQEEVKARRRAEQPYQLPAGEPGECDRCGEWSGRLINGACAPCRDRYRL